MAEVKVTKKGYKAIEKAVESLVEQGDKIADPHKEYAKAIGAVAFKAFIENFEKEQGPKGKWDAWSPAYSRRMKDIGKGGNKILQDTGHMRQNFKPENYFLRKGEIGWFNNAKTRTGFPYAAHHDEGRSSSKGNPRPFMWMNDKSLELVTQITLAFLTKGFGRG